MKYVCSACGWEVEMSANPVECSECGDKGMHEVNWLYSLDDLDDKELRDVRNAIEIILKNRAAEEKSWAKR
jgi:hypothetical protein